MLNIESISKSFGKFELKPVQLKIESGEYFILLGASGSGKTVLLEIIAGLIHPDTGTISIDGQEITNIKIQNRKIGLVFQDHAIFPHLSVYDNIAYPLKSTGAKKSEIKLTVEELAGEMNILPLLRRKAINLSGGEKQRIALARVLAMNPKCLLLDEPFASLDVQLKSELRTLLRQINGRGISILHVTHDYEEALSLADKVAVINDGQLLQSGTPEEVFRYPKNRFVANFVGVKNFFRADLLDFIDKSEERLARVSDTLSFTLISNQSSGNGYVFLRSKSVILSEDSMKSSASNSFQGKVIQIEKTPKGYEVLLDIGVKIFVTITERSYHRLSVAVDRLLWVSFKASALRFQKT
jgi:molybdopterin-binding protein